MIERAVEAGRVIGRLDGNLRSAIFASAKSAGTIADADLVRLRNALELPPS